MSKLLDIGYGFSFIQHAYVRRASRKACDNICDDENFPEVEM